MHRQYQEPNRNTKHAQSLNVDNNTQNSLMSSLFNLERTMEGWRFSLSRSRQDQAIGGSGGRRLQNQTSSLQILVMVVLYGHGVGRQDGAYLYTIVAMHRHLAVSWLSEEVSVLDNTTVLLAATKLFLCRFNDSSKR